MSDNLVEFLLERITEEEATAHDVQHQASLGVPMVEIHGGGTGVRELTDPLRWLAECKARLRIIELHESWPVLVEKAPTFDSLDDRLDTYVMHMSRQIAWMTEREYRNRFGSEPPTGPILRALASVYADHPDFNPEWLG